MPEPPASAADGDEVVFFLADPDRIRSSVRLWVDIDVDVARDFHRRDGGWELRVRRPPVDRLEYLLEVDGVLVTDPGNPRRVGGAFGDHSWLPLPGYLPPAWLERPTPPGHHRPLEVPDTPVGPVTGAVWAREGDPPDRPLPLLVCHDGAEMDDFGALTRYVAAMVHAGRLPPLRVALLAPGERDSRYAASPRYAEALVERVLPALAGAWAISGLPVLMGQSLGALAALHAAWTHPGLVAGLFLQSGSFLTPDLDPQESGFSHWTEVTDFIRLVHEATTPPTGTGPVTLVCGTAEENVANNRLMARHLAEIGVTVSWGEVRDGHHWTSWRDLLDPHLTDLLTAVWS